MAPAQSYEEFELTRSKIVGGLDRLLAQCRDLGALEVNLAALDKTVRTVVAEAQTLSNQFSDRHVRRGIQDGAQDLKDAADAFVELAKERPPRVDSHHLIERNRVGKNLRDVAQATLDFFEAHQRPSSATQGLRNSQRASVTQVIEPDRRR
ncbi:hypothetical protein [Nonomuraea basaltis]|uniref:hypothetical protein n=1 Tax=Nonomuraea basaltis TaxID=2495887 RepID=UPI00110C5FAB|nr:hypothetical protein [Nonomuraea basaltis]TMR96123.1 hypothetical protein EJK15_25265 [Nonomuraea basaltis]